MNNFSRCGRIATGLLALSMAASCAVTGEGYYSEPTMSYGIGFYEPWGYGYDNWDRAYRVGPPRGGEHRSFDGAHRYRSAAPSRPTPSIPTRARRPRAPR